MTYTKNIPHELSFETLFADGVCLTYYPFAPLDNFKYAKKLEEEYRKQNGTSLTEIKTHATLSMLSSYHNKIHYFSNGTLIYNFYRTENKDNICLKRLMKMFEIRKLPVNKVYDLSKFFDYISASVYMEDLEQYALKVYSIKDQVKITTLPSIDDFVKDCFANGNILLTASKDEDVDSDIRNYIALFADGCYYMSEGKEYLQYVKGSVKNQIFRKEHNDFIFMEMKLVPQSYIDALYKEAEKYDWYISEEEQKQKNTPSSDELEEMNKYIEKLFSTRKCLSVTNIERDKSLNYFGACPDTDEYALFSDGLFLISNKSKKDEYWLKYLSKAYKDIEIKVEFVPDFYIPAIYSNLPKYQRGARKIYMEMFKERVKKIKKELNIPHHEALEIVARGEHWNDYKSINIENEAIARYLISRLLLPLKSTEFYVNLHKNYLKEKGGNNE